MAAIDKLVGSIDVRSMVCAYALFSGFLVVIGIGLRCDTQDPSQKRP